MKVLKKTAFLILFLFVIRVVQSCCHCGEDPIAFDFEEVSLRNLDNTGSYVTWSDDNIMYAKAVAFQVDVSGLYTGCLDYKMQNFGFADAMACSCDPFFDPNQEINEITIITLNSISPEIPADTDVTELFLALFPEDNNPSSHFYLTFENLYSKINRNTYSGAPATSFQIFCKEEVLNNVAQFSVTIHLSDGRILTGASEIISILPNS